MTTLALAALVTVLAAVVSTETEARGPAWLGALAAAAALALHLVPGPISPLSATLAGATLGAALVNAAGRGRGAAVLATAFGLAMLVMELGPTARFTATSALHVLGAVWPAVAAGAGLGLWLDEAHERAPRTALLGAVVAAIVLTTALDPTLGLAMQTGLTDAVGTPVEVVTHWAEGSLAMATSITVQTVLPWGAPMLVVLGLLAALGLAGDTLRARPLPRLAVSVAGLAVLALGVAVAKGALVPPTVADPMLFGATYVAPFAPAEAVAVPYPSAPHLRFALESAALLMAFGAWAIVVGARPRREALAPNGARWLWGTLLVVAASVGFAALRAPGPMDIGTLAAPILGVFAWAVGPSERARLGALLVGGAIALFMIRVLWGMA